MSAPALAHCAFASQLRLPRNSRAILFARGCTLPHWPPNRRSRPL